MSTNSQALGVPIPEPHVDTWNESMGMVTDALNAADALVGDIATIETSPSSAAHSVGEFLLYDGRLYRVTAPISAGASLTLGTNVEAAKLGTHLTSIGSSIAYVESTTATANHASGDHFMLGNVLMKATSAIATGEQITTSNATPDDMQAQIDTIRNSMVSSISRSETSFTAKNSKGTSLFTFNQKDDDTTYAPSSVSTTFGTWRVLSFGKLHLCWLTRTRVTIACTSAFGSGYYGSVAEPVYPKSGALIYEYVTPASANISAIGTGHKYMFCPTSTTESVDIRYFAIILTD